MIYETSISTVENPAQAAARLFESQLIQARQGDPGAAPSRGPQAADASLGGRRMAAHPQPRRPFGRTMRLRQAREFARVRREGRRISCGCFIANWQVLPPGSG